MRLCYIKKDHLCVCDLAVFWEQGLWLQPRFCHMFVMWLVAILGQLAPTQRSQTYANHPWRILHWVDLLVSHRQRGDWESGAESVCEEGEHGVNLKPYLCLFVAAHVHWQLR